MSYLFLVHGSEVKSCDSLFTQYNNNEFPIQLGSVNDSEPVSPRTIEGIATGLIEMIRKVQPMGPYRIAGWSFGGLVAYEIATQLIGEDQEVVFIGLTDTLCRAALGDVQEHCAEESYGVTIVLTAMLPNIKGLNEEQGTTSKRPLRAGVIGDFVTFMDMDAVHLQPASPGAWLASRLSETQLRPETCRRAVTQYMPHYIPVAVHLFAGGNDHCLSPLASWRAVLPETQIRVIPTSAMYESVNISEVVSVDNRVLRESVRPERANLPPLAELTYRPLVPLHVGQHKSPTVFCVPGAGASVTNFVELLAYLPEAWTIYGLEPRGLDGTLVPHSTAAASARFVLSKVYELRGDHPINLLGHSFGGWVAFEIARQLLEAGHRIASLLILDSEAPDDDEEVIKECERTDVAMNMIEALELLLKKPMGIHRPDMELLSDSSQQALIHQNLVREGLLPMRSQPSVLHGPLRTLGMALRSRYKPKGTYPGPASLILVDDPRLDKRANQRKQDLLVEGWKKYVSSLTCFHIPGNHLTALKAPHVRELARILAQSII